MPNRPAWGDLDWDRPAPASINGLNQVEATEIIDAWPTLSKPIRAGILAMIRSASGKGDG